MEFKMFCKLAILVVAVFPTFVVSELFKDNNNNIYWNCEWLVAPIKNAKKIGEIDGELYGYRKIRQLSPSEQKKVERTKEKIMQSVRKIETNIDNGIHDITKNIDKNIDKVVDQTMANKDKKKYKKNQIKKRDTNRYKGRRNSNNKKQKGKKNYDTDEETDEATEEGPEEDKEEDTEAATEEDTEVATEEDTEKDSDEETKEVSDEDTKHTDLKKCGKCGKNVVRKNSGIDPGPMAWVAPVPIEYPWNGYNNANNMVGYNGYNGNYVRSVTQNADKSLTIKHGDKTTIIKAKKPGGKNKVIRVGGMVINLNSTRKNSGNKKSGVKNQNMSVENITL